MRPYLLYIIIFSLFTFPLSSSAQCYDDAGFCVEKSTDASQGSFSEGYTVNFTTSGSTVTATFKLLDSDKVGVIAYIWKESPFSESQMTNTTGNEFTASLSNQSPESVISYACKFAFAGGMSVTKYFSYRVGSIFCESECGAVGVSGCTDATAFNYDASATVDDGSCVDVALGCTDATALNYDALANTNDDSCIAVVLGCTDTTASNYDVSANRDDGSCTAVVEGCTNSQACNYNQNATDDDQSCLIPTGCESCSEDNTQTLLSNDADNDGICDADESAGCTRPNADNYNPQAYEDDGSCLYNGAIECVKPEPYLISGGTGSNMTLLLLPNFLSNLPITDRSSYLVAMTPSGLVVGSEVVALVSQAQMTIWADDSTTDEVDGAIDGESITFQLVDAGNLYDVVMSSPVSFKLNETSIQPSSTYALNCSGILGCNDPIADNFNALATIDDGSCKYSPCAALVASDFAIEYDADIAKPVLSYNLKNTLSDQDFLNPGIELVLYESTLELGTASYSSSTIQRNGFRFIRIPIFNDLSSYDLPESLSGLVLVSGSGSLDNEPVSCEVNFTNIPLNTDQVGCKVSDAYNYSSLVTIDDGMCVENLSVTIDSENPTCSYEYGSAIIHVTGDSRSILSKYTSDTLYNWRASTGAISMRDSIRFVDGYATLTGLFEGEYIIGLKDFVVVNMDTIVIERLDTFSITKPVAVEVEIENLNALNEPLSYKVNQGEVVSQQWLYKGVPLPQATNSVHFPQEKGVYQLYVENQEGCGFYSETVRVTTLDVNTLSDAVFNLHPNPAQSTLNITLSNLAEVKVVLTDLLGQELKQFFFDVQSSKSVRSIDISELPSGLYFVRVEQGARQLVKRFIKN